MRTFSIQPIGQRDAAELNSACIQHDVTHWNIIECNRTFDPLTKSVLLMTEQSVTYRDEYIENATLLPDGCRLDRIAAA